MPFEEFNVYTVEIKGTYRIKADSPQDAVNKAKEWVEASSDDLDYSWSMVKVQEEVEE